MSFVFDSSRRSVLSSLTQAVFLIDNIRPEKGPLTTERVILPKESPQDKELISQKLLKFKFPRRMR